jgi:hypothetical protein
MDLYNTIKDNNNNEEPNSYDNCIILQKELDKYKLKVQELQTCIDILSVENNKLKKNIEDYKSTIIYTKDDEDDEDEEDEDDEDDEDDEEEDDEDEDDEEEEDDEDDDGYNTEDENATEEEYSPKKLSKRNKEECIIC